MKLMEALNVLDIMSSRAHGSREDHAAVVKALTLLKEHLEQKEGKDAESND